MSMLEKAILAASSPVQFDETSAVKKEFVFGADFVGFDGHFPGNPILPAMVQLMLGALTVVEAADEALVVRDAGRAKFLKRIVPNDRIVVTASVADEGDVKKANITLTVHDEIASTFHLCLTRAETS